MVEWMMAVVAVAAVNVNTAQQSELQGIKGMSPAKAKAVIEHRNQHGQYTSIEDLQKVLDEPTFERVKPQLALTGDPFTPPPKPEKKSATPAAPRKQQGGNQ
jgi:competence protein ComEA